MKREKVKKRIKGILDEIDDEQLLDELVHNTFGYTYYEAVCEFGLPNETLNEAVRKTIMNGMFEE